MDFLAVSLGPAFAAGFAVQRLADIADPIVEKLVGDTDKKLVLAVLAFVVGLVLAWGSDLRVLEPLGIDDAEAADIVVTALVVSAGTEGFNSIMKFLTYAKENKRSQAALSAQNAPAAQVALLQHK